MLTKVCCECGETLPIHKFRIIKKKGKIYYNNKCNYCKHEQSHNWNIKNSKRAWCISTLSNHKSNGYIINISLDELYTFIENIDYCYICGKELDWSRGTKGNSKQNSPSLDRLNNEKVIEPNNIQILCRNCNNSKSDKSIEELVEWCKQVIKIYGE